MTRKAVFLALAMGAVTSPAFAKQYDIKLDGYCDRLRFTVVQGKLHGASIGKSHGLPCDDAPITGTAAIAAAPVTPTGSIVTASSDFGEGPAAFITYISLGNNTFTIYGTTDGHRMFSISGTWSSVGTGPDARVTAAAAETSTEPKITAHFFEKSTRVEGEK